ncbi:MAG: carbohydrate ABC transporter permease [Agathobacter sp.]|nr:carbohydrate ABC transporter permease [Agathobacter sp.]
MFKKNNKENIKVHAKAFGVDAIVYFLLICIGFVFLYPLLYMVVTSLMCTEDLINPTISWVPTRIDLSNFEMVWSVLDYPTSLGVSVGFSVACAVLQTISCALMGYAMSRFHIPFKMLWMALLIFIFIIPADVVTIPRYILFNELKLIGSPLAMVLPAALGQGLKSSIFVLIFMQAFNAVPKSYDEAAQLDGAGRLKVFFIVALPMAIPSIVLCLLFSLVWYWNETAQVAMLIGGDFQTLPLQLDAFNSLFGASFSTDFGDTANRLNERYQFAATLLTIVPLILFYLVMQKQFVKGIESAGITGE